MSDILTREQIADLCTGDSADSRALMFHDTALRAALATVTQERDMLAAFQDLLVGDSFPKETELLRLQREVEALKQERDQAVRQVHDCTVKHVGNPLGLRLHEKCDERINQLEQQLATAQARVKELESGHEAARSLNKPSPDGRS